MPCSTCQGSRVVALWPKNWPFHQVFYIRIKQIKNSIVYPIIYTILFMRIIYAFHFLIIVKAQIISGY